MRAIGHGVSTHCQISAEMQTRVRKLLQALKAFGFQLETEITEATASFFCDTLVEMEIGLMIEVVGFTQYVVPGAFSTNFSAFLLSVTQSGD